MPTKKSPPNRAIGAAIRALRKAQGCTQEEFALKAGIDRSYYGAIERGEFNVTVDTLVTIAKGLGVRPSEILRRAQL
ncbi:MAG TPA: helix-turn-helix transcriptional regulator [Solirubrobacteraceae bacterium]|jgi:transcriptional regulator with XRE-family HTH domain|nr:helix-turn-helix transcriptional regulator [Solirubrobacteraceae bacterium]